MLRIAFYKSGSLIVLRYKETYFNLNPSLPSFLVFFLQVKNMADGSWEPNSDIDEIVIQVMNHVNDEVNEPEKYGVFFLLLSLILSFFMKAKIRRWIFLKNREMIWSQMAKI